jgi:hypothetical protein
MTTAQVTEDIRLIIHGEFCECAPCRAWKGLKPADPNDEIGLTCDEDGGW